MKLGVIGGLGPMASAYFCELVVNMTQAHCDQDHLECVIFSCPQIPDRTSFILGKSDKNPLPSIVEVGRKLKMLETDVIAIPCITAHYFHKEIEEEIGLPVINAIEETSKLLHDGGVRRVGILATDGTIQTGIFQKQIEKYGMEAVIPDKEIQAQVMSLIYDDIKAKNIPDMDKFQIIKNYMWEQGAEVTILGCTELSLVKKAYDIGDGFIDAMEVLAKISVESCGKEVKPEYETLYKIIELD